MRLVGAAPFFVALGAGCALVSGLSGLDVGVTGPSVDASTDATTDAGSDAATDAALPNDAALDGTAFVDAATCGPPPGDSTPIQSTCVTGTPLYQTGTIPPGTYDLTMVRVFPASCNGFVSTKYSGRLVVTGTSSPFVIDERITAGNVTTSRRYDAMIVSNLVFVAQSCGPTNAVQDWGLFVSSSNGKATVSFYVDDGKTAIRYFWTQQ